MEQVYAQTEEDNFEGILETRDDIPYNYPYDGSVDFNIKISELTAIDDKKIDPAKVLPARRGDRMTVSSKYFYVEDAPGQTYDNLTNLVEEILVSLAGNGSGVLPLNARLPGRQELQLIDIASGNTDMGDELYDFLSQNIDTTLVGKPYAYMSYIFYDNNFKIVPGASRVIQVENPNELGTLADLDIEAPVDGYMHAYVSNGSSAKVNFDNFMITYLRGKTRQFNEYYPYGLSNTGLNGYSNEYPFKYQGKEYQSEEWNGYDNGLEMYDFDARFYEPALGRWFVPDPAEQFHNPYLAMGNNPVVYTDPDGKFVWAPIIIGAMIGSFTGAMSAGYSGASNGQIMASFGIGALAGGVSGGLGTSQIAFANTAAIVAGSTISSVGNAQMYNSDISTNFGAFSVNWTEGKLKSFSKDNTFLENLGYGLGAFANVSDAFSVLSGVSSTNSSTVELQSDNHSSLHDPDNNTLLDVGAVKPRNTITNKEGLAGGLELSTDYRAHQASIGQKINNTPFLRRQQINGVRLDRIQNYKNQLLGSGKTFGLLNVLGGQSMNCSFGASMALLKSGVFNVPIGIPGLLSIQMYARQYSHMSYIFNEP